MSLLELLFVNSQMSCLIRLNGFKYFFNEICSLTHQGYIPCPPALKNDFTLFLFWVALKRNERL